MRISKESSGLPGPQKMKLARDLRSQLVRKKNQISIHRTVKKFFTGCFAENFGIVYFDLIHIVSFFAIIATCTTLRNFVY